MTDDKIVIKAFTSVMFTFEEEGHLTMKEIRDKVKTLLEPTGGKIKNIKLAIIEDWDEK